MLGKALKKFCWSLLPNEPKNPPGHTFPNPTDKTTYCCQTERTIKNYHIRDVAHFLMYMKLLWEKHKGLTFNTDPCYALSKGMVVLFRYMHHIINFNLWKTGSVFTIFTLTNFLWFRVTLPLLPYLIYDFINRCVHRIR